MRSGAGGNPSGGGLREVGVSVRTLTFANRAKGARYRLGIA